MLSPPSRCCSLSSDNSPLSHSSYSAGGSFRDCHLIAACSQDLLTRHKPMVAAYLNSHYEEV